MSYFEIAIIGVSLGLLLVLSLVKRSRGGGVFRPIRAIDELRKTIELSVEDGSRLQVSLGSGDLLSTHGAAALAGLSLLRQVGRIASDSDQPPLATSGDPISTLLSQDTLRKTYQDLGIAELYTNRLGRLTGLSPLSYAAGTMPLILDGSVSSTALAGSFGADAALISSASRRQEAFSIGGSDTLSGQAVLFAGANQPLIAEELYAAGAYLKAGPAHDASLQTQDILRWLIILAILAFSLYQVVALFF